MTWAHFAIFYSAGACVFGGWFLTDFIHSEKLRDEFKEPLGVQVVYAIVFLGMMALMWWYFLPIEVADRINKWRNK